MKSNLLHGLDTLVQCLTYPLSSTLLVNADGESAKPVRQTIQYTTQSSLSTWLMVLTWMMCMTQGHAWKFQSLPDSLVQYTTMLMTSTHLCGWPGVACFA